MAKRVSHSQLDPWLTTPLRGLYPRLRIPSRLPPEAIVTCGHVAAIVGAAGFACSTRWWWGGLLAALGVALNHACDVLDGTHARATNQCRNGGELLDHFVDPLSFAYWAAGLSYGALNYSPWAPWMGMAGIAVIFATAVLTNIRAKMIGEFTLARFGPTEFKTLLVLLALFEAALVGVGGAAANQAPRLAFWFIVVMTIAGAVQLLISLVRAVREVNAETATAADSTEWQVSAQPCTEEGIGSASESAGSGMRSAGTTPAAISTTLSEKSTAK
jgi:phosphatidylglycerophosphate synthase